MTSELSPEQAVREFYACYSDGRPQDFDAVVADDYADYGHQPPGRGPDGARADYEHAVQVAGGITTYVIDALVVDDDDAGHDATVVAVVWTGTLPSGDVARGLSTYRVRDGKLTSTRHVRLP